MQAYSSEQLVSLAATLKDVKFGMLSTSDDMLVDPVGRRPGWQRQQDDAAP